MDRRSRAARTGPAGRRSIARVASGESGLADEPGMRGYLFDADVKDPSLYDLLINTAVLSREAAVGLLAEAARRP